MWMLVVSNSGCTAISPSKSAVLTEIQALHSGVYEQRISRQQEHLRQLKQRQQLTHHNLQSVKEKRAQAERTVSRLAVETERLDRQTEQKEGKVRQLIIRRQRLQQEAKALQRSLSVLDKHLADVKANDSAASARVIELTRERDRLRRQLEALIAKSL